VSGEIRIQVKRYDLIDQTRWENIAAGIGAEKTWFFIVDCSRAKLRLRYFFFFGRHYWTEQDTEQDRAEQRVCLLVSEDAGDGNPRRLDDIPSCPLTLREVFLVGDALVRRQALPDGSVEYDRNASSLRTAQDFLRDVILRRLVP
jgi:hypothetical protein